MERDEHELTSSYALHALGDEERERLLEQAKHSPTLRAELDSMDETAAMLALNSSAVVPPARLKSRIMDEISRTPQLPREDLVPPTPVATDQAGTPQAVQTGAVPEAASSPRSTKKFFALAAAILLLASAGLGTVVLVQNAEQRELQAQVTTLNNRQLELTQLLGAADVQNKTQSMPDGATVTLSYSVSTGLMAVTTTGMAQLPEDQGYEFWLISAQGAQPAGMLHGAEANGLQLLSGPMDGISHFGITVEPAAGSPAPTTEPLMVQEL
ncbi:anti-sigma factor domain-containing protein [Glutamicibacter sp. NPDC087344]|uniref:anti-sigma factor n=1 Tax=Glutamicibacter sp. NPDC087344 TaxID=3363994 RepID=UPI00380F4A24